MDDSGAEFSGIPAETIDELLKQGEECLAGTVQFSVAADQRASTWAALAGAASVALIATAGSNISGGYYYGPFFWACLAPAVPLFVAAIIFILAAKPIDFFVAGYEPRMLQIAAGDLLWMKRYVCEDIQMRIDHNRAALEKNSKLTHGGVTLTLASPVLAIITFAVAKYLS